MADWALVTGASEGLGREFARLAAASGYNVALAARQREKLETLAGELASRHGVSVEALPADLARHEEVEGLWQAATAGRRVAVLVNNAGLARNGAFAEGGWDRELASIEVNVVALTMLAKLAVPHMRETGEGRILNVASTAAFMPGPGMAVYHATKAYVLSLSEALAQELAGSGVTITCLAPGATATNFQRDADIEDMMLMRMMRPASAERVAQAGWNAMMRGRRSIVPGVFNQVSALSPRFVPRRVAAALTQRFLARGPR